SLTPARRVRAHSTTSEATWSANGTSAYGRYDDQPNSSVVTQNWTTVGTIGWPCCDRNSCSTRSPRPRSRYISTYQSSAVNQRCEPRHTQYTVATANPPTSSARAARRESSHPTAGDASSRSAADQ